MSPLESLALALVAGTTLLLTAGAVLGARAIPVRRQRAAEAAVAACLAFIALAPLPLPRPLAFDRGMVDAQPPASAVPAHADEPPPPTRPPVAHAAQHRDGARDRAATAITPSLTPALPWWALAYLLGSGLCCAWLALGALRLHVLLRSAQPLPPDLAALADEAGLGGCRVVVSARTNRPFACRARRPTVVLPARTLRHAALPHVLRHEAVHVARGDLWSRVLFAAAMPWLWPQPLFWWLRARARHAGECVADAVAARGRHTEYARALLDLCEHERAAVVPAGVLPAFRTRSDLTERLEMLLARRVPLTSRLSPFQRLAHLAGASAATLLLGAAFGMRAPAQDPARTEQPAQPAAAPRTDLAREIERLREAIDQLTRTLPERSRADDSDAGRVTVQAGDTLVKLLARHGYPVTDGMLEQVVRLNPGLDPRRMTVGQELRLPPRTARAARTEDPAPALETPHGDALDYVLRTIDAQSEVERATSRLQLRAEQKARGVATEQDLLEAKIQLRAAERRCEAVQAAVHTEIDLATKELRSLQESMQRARNMYESGLVSAAELQAHEARRMRVEARLKLLGKALQ
ncbi:MAG TPA: M56 family metallopeptidase [Planctomycetota bacterium]|nr:M56 family metallopeptidase [Planctomycetota bacterium]